MYGVRKKGKLPEKSNKNDNDPTVTNSTENLTSSEIHRCEINFFSTDPSNFKILYTFGEWVWVKIFKFELVDF